MMKKYLNQYFFDGETFILSYKTQLGVKIAADYTSYYLNRCIFLIKICLIILK